MASKRKKSRPTKIAENYEVPEALNSPDVSPFVHEDTTSRIQKFLNEASEDTPESLFCQRLPVAKILVPGGECLANDEISTEGLSTSAVFNNENIPVNLRFHQLLKDEFQLDQHTLMNGFDSRTESWQIPMSEGMDEISTTDIESEEIVVPSLKNENHIPADKVKGKKALKKKGRQKDVQDSPRYSCSVCKYVTNRSDHFKRHLMTHSEDKPLKCTMCGYGTGRSDHYKRHLQRHGMSEKDIVDCCARNGLKLKHATLMLSAEDRRTKENGHTSKILKPLKPGRPQRTVIRKKYSCKECGYSTDKSSHYHRHIRTHSGERPYACQKCRKTFKMPLHLNKHSCGRSFQRRCSNCKLIFIDHKALLEHHAEKHPSDPILLGNEEEEIGDEECTKRGEAEIRWTPGENAAREASKNFFRNFSKMASEIICNNISTKPASGNMETSSAELNSSGDAVSPEKISEHPASVADTEPSIIISIVTGGTDREGGDLDPLFPPLSHSQDKKGNLKCTICGLWFARLDEYSSHTCVS